MIRQLIQKIFNRFRSTKDNRPVNKEGVVMDKYSVLYLSFPPDTPLPVAIDRYKDKYHIEPTKAIVPVRQNTDSPFHYDLENLAQGASIEIETSYSVSTVMITNYNISWRNG